MKKSTIKHRKWYLALFTAFTVFLLSMTSLYTQAQVNYSVSGTTGGTYTTLSGGGITVINSNAGLTSTTGMPSSGGQDDGIASVPLPFSFNFMGNTYTSAWFCTNGWVGFGDQTAVTASQGRTGGSLFTTTVPNNMIGAWFKDMGANFPATQPGTGPGSMRYGLSGTDVFTFQWDQACGTSFSITTTTLISFQISIYGPASVKPGRIELLYGPTLGTISFASNLGIENATGGPGNFLNALNASTTTASTSTAWPGNGNGYRFEPLSPCVSPTAQPTALNLSTISISQINGSFTAASPAPSGYLVVRYPGGSAVTNPANGTVYAAGQSLGLGTVVAYGNSTTFNSTGLSGGTTYDYYVYSYNDVCVGAPFFRTVINAGQNSGSATTLPCGSMPSTITVGPTGTYPTLSGAGGAIAALAASGISAPLTIELLPAYTSASETFPITMNFNACVTAAKPVTIRPQLGAGPLTITSANTTATIDLNGANFVTIDGRAGGVGTVQNLIIENTSTTAAAAGNAILMRNDAVNNTLTYLNVRSANANVPTNTVISTAGSIPGAIAIGTTTGVLGNDNNTISFCDIHSVTSGGNLGACIYAANGTTAGAVANNDNNSILNNNIYDFFLAASASAGIDISLGNNNYTINNNRLYQAGLRTYTSTQTIRGMWITPNTGALTSASGFTISGNTIGYNTSAGTGTYSMTGTTAYVFNGMDISVGLGAASSVQGNTITNMNMTATSTSSTAFVGINVANGVLNIGTVTGNLFGSNTTNGAISFTTAGNAGGVIGIRIGGGTTVNVSNNQVSGVNVSGSTTSFTANFNGINVAGGTTVNITNNIVGSTSLANSINGVTATISTTAQNIRGIVVNAGTPTTTVTGNTVANMNTNIVATGTQATSVQGIFVSVGSSTVSNNVVRNLSSSAQTTAGGSTSVVVGIAYTATTAPAVISGNTIHSLALSNATATAAIQCEGIFYGGPTTGSANLIERNLIHSLSMANPSNSAGFLTAMDISTGLVTIRNNMVRLGYYANGNSITSPCTLRGISENSATTSVFHNSVFVGGTGVGSTATNTFAYQRSGTTGADSVVNNVFVNNRSNLSTGGKHYQVLLTTSNSGFTGNYNVYYGNGTGTVFGNTGAADVAAYAAGWVAGDNNSLVGDPQFINPTGNAATGDLHINPTLSTPVELGGVLIASVVADYDGQTRATLSPTDIGADAGNFTPLNACSGIPSGGTISGAAAVCSGSGTTLSLTPPYTGVGLTYQWASSTTAGGPFTTLLGTSTIQSTGILNAPTYFVCTITCNFGGGTYTTPVKSVLINALPAVGVSASSSVFCSPGGNAVTLTANGASTYAWNPTTGLTPTSGSPVAASPSAATTYTVTGTDGNGCVSSATITLSVSAAISVTSVTANPSTICPGAASSLQASAGFALATYCQSTHTSGCSGDNIASVSLNTLTNTNSACGLTGSTPPRYLYQSGPTAPTTTLSASSTYTLTLSFGTDPNQYFGAWIDFNQDGLLDASEFLGASGNAGASGTTSVVFTVPVNAYNGLTRLRIIGGNDSPLTSSQACGASSSPWGETQDYDITISGGISPLIYTWSSSNPATLPVNTGNPVNVTNVPSTSTYSVVVSSAGGCTATGSATVTIIPLVCSAPTVSSGVKCAGNTFTVTANYSGGGSPYSYTWNDGVGGVYPNAQTITANLPAGGYTFTVTVSDACGSFSTSTATVNVLANPVVTLSSSLPVNCVPGAGVTFTASGASTYAYNPTTGLTPTSGAIVNANPSAATTYTVIGTDGNGCSATAQVALNVSASIAVNSVTASPNTFCHVGASTLTAIANSYVAPEAYCAAGANTIGCTGTDEAISNVTFNTINNNSSCPAVSPQYQDFTSISTNVTAGSTYTINVTNVHSYSGDQITAWIDYDHSGVFDAGEATIIPYIHVTSGINISIGSITIPANAYNGPTRMRIRLNYSGTMDPCGLTSYGEVEDYTVNILGGINQTYNGPFAGSFAWTQSGSSTMSGSTSDVESVSNITSTTTYFVTATSTDGCSATGSVVVSNLANASTINVNHTTSCYTWPVTGLTYGSNGTYVGTLVNSNANGCDSVITMNLTLAPGITLRSKAILAGAYNAGTGLMTDILRTTAQLPSTEPYTAAPYLRPVIGGPAGETASPAVLAVSGSNAVTDWIFLELRSAVNMANVIATKRALILRNGDIVSNVDGTSPVFFPGIAPGNYYVTVKHRNHLGVMTAVPVAIGPCGAATVIDFTTDPVWVKPGEVNPPRKLIGAVQTLWAGDANINKNTKYNGLSNDKQAVVDALGGNANAVLGPVYRPEDVNLDSQIKYNNVDNDRNIIASMIGVNTPNNIVNQHTPN